MEVAVGARLPEWRVPAVSAEKMKTTAALLADPNPIHWDVEVVRALGMGERPINQGPLNMGYVLNMLAAWSGGHDRLRRFRVRFRGNVFAGDELRAGGSVTGVREEAGMTVADCDVSLDVVGGTTVLSGTAAVIVGPVNEENA
ncbi:MaoC family dehydratase [Saccharopolyspora sp. TS4A08]|uniref:MaoC family dehydratase n=1 Tax=Saccharopolyspora ipomoeae TaxID=3042027 RepID=A0ABT6PJC9_9PSEU|nr:MaoC family dehydratase [Saccharopolyspora sp. TS4A08]MDI2027758.1 MaoC family dehydratase [Saccharopolyspora sp. TS4A08]